MSKPKIAIIGAGFSGLMTAVHLIQNADNNLEIFLIDRSDRFAKGWAYSTFSEKHLLNVSVAKMTAFPADKKHFFNWIQGQKEYKGVPTEVLEASYVPRQLFGRYLQEIWKDTLVIANQKKIEIHELFTQVKDLNLNPNSAELELESGEKIETDFVVLATGNQLPAHPDVANFNFEASPQYFQNPWNPKIAETPNPSFPILIFGNGLSMVDAVLAIEKSNPKAVIFAISPNGFNVLPHRHGGMQYQALVDELQSNITLKQLFSLVYKHVKQLRKNGVSAEPVVNSLRPFSQQIWQSFDVEEKQLFMKKFRHLWGVARHRLPLPIHDKIQKLRIDNQLYIISGKIESIQESKVGFEVKYFDKNQKKHLTISVAKIINCTGPNGDISTYSPQNLLKKCWDKNLITQDELKLGISANPVSFEIQNPNGGFYPHFLTLGPTLKGELWESTAIHELREQAVSLANKILKKIENHNPKTASQENKS